MCATPAGSVSAVSGGSGGPAGSSATTAAAAFLALRFRGALAAGVTALSAAAGASSTYTTAALVRQGDTQRGAGNSVIVAAATTALVERDEVTLTLAAVAHPRLCAWRQLLDSAFTLVFTTRVLTRMLTPTPRFGLRMATRKTTERRE